MGGIYLEGRAGVLVDSGADPEGRLEGIGGPVVHDRKLAIGWHQLQCALCLKPIQRHALVKIAVVQHDGVAPAPVAPVIHRARCLSPPDHQAVIQCNGYGWVACQVALHLHKCNVQGQ